MEEPFPRQTPLIQEVSAQSMQGLHNQAPMGMPKPIIRPLQQLLGNIAFPLRPPASEPVLEPSRSFAEGWKGPV